MTIDGEYRPDVPSPAWGPFVPESFVHDEITVHDVIIASVVWGMTLMNAVIALYLAYGQTKSSRSPMRSVYIWLIWLELAISFCMGVECYLHLLKIIRPSFAFYFTILFWWCVQTQLLLQIIINRIRIIVPDRRRSRHIMIWTAVIVAAINISVFNIWIPARLQISTRYMRINEIWDRVEKVLYLIIDGLLNWYFLKSVKENLVSNGLQKYNKVVRFNERIIILSLLMDVMIIAAMSIPNSFVYIQFHPLAYLVKLNIEMTMANLIKRIALSSSHLTGNSVLALEFATLDFSASVSGFSPQSDARRGSVAGITSETSLESFDKREEGFVGFVPKGNQIKVTETFLVSNEPHPDYD